MDDLGLRTKMSDLAGHPVIKARTHRDQHIAMMHRHIGLIGAVHTEHPDKLRIGARISPKPHEGIGNGITQIAGELDELR
jgi:hypothetical protein